jgi:glycosyltransferase involved in cell wall biosynthesis
MRYPSPVAGLGIPFVIGPVGGSIDTPPGFADQDTAPWYVGLRRLDHLRIRHDPLLRRTYEQSGCVLGIGSYVKDFLDPVVLRRFEVMFETGIERLPDIVDRTGRHGDVRLLFVGRLVRTKGARDAIRALGSMRRLPIVLDIVGDGFDRTACEALTAELGLVDRVRFHGRLPRTQVNEFYAAADIFVFPSYREPGGNAPLEAMSYGLPLIVSDLGGPATVVDDSCGIRLHPLSPDQYAQAIAGAIATLVTDPARRHAMGERARQRAGAIALWENKITQIEAIYANVMADDRSSFSPSG